MSMPSYLLWIQPLGPLLVLPGLAKRRSSLVAAALISAIIPAFIRQANQSYERALPLVCPLHILQHI